MWVERKNGVEWQKMGWAGMERWADIPENAWAGVEHGVGGHGVGTELRAGVTKTGLSADGISATHAPLTRSCPWLACWTIVYAAIVYRSTACQFVQQMCIVFVLSGYLFRDVAVEARISSNKCCRQHWTTSTKETLSAIHFHSEQTSYSSHSGCHISTDCEVTGYFTSCDVTAAWPCERCQLERFIGNGWGYAAAPSGKSWTVRLSWKIFYLW